MKEKINSYLATLIIVIMGAAAVWVIMRIADANSFTTTTVSGSEKSYEKLKQSILKQ